MKATVRDAKTCKITENTVEVVEPTIDNIISVYSGKPGCMCGCNGNYRYHPEMVEEAGKRRGYAVDEDEVSARSIKTIITKIKNAGALVDEGNEGKYIFAETATRVYTAYYA